MIPRCGEQMAYSPQFLRRILASQGRAIDGAQTTLGGVLAKARFWEDIRGVPLNHRQRLVLNRVLDGLEGKLTTSKYAKPCETFWLSSNAAFSSATKKAAGARATPCRQ